MISIDNLSPAQIKLADQLWAFDTEDQVYEWFLKLPTPLKFDAYQVLQLMVLAYQDQEAEQDLSEAQEIINRISQM